MLPVMTTTEFDDADIGTSANRTGLYLGILQLVFTLGWTTYVIYLPKLAAQVGIAPTAVILILMLDQAIFTITDTAMGIAADRIAPFVGRLGLFVGLLTAISCAAFVALPFVAGVGKDAQFWLIALIVVWAITSSALRAPPLTLLGKHRAKSADPVPVGAGHAGLWRCRRGLALSRRRAAQSGCAASVRDFQRGLADHHAGAVLGRAWCRGSGTGETRRAGKAARHGAGDLHRRDGHSRTGLSTAFLHQQRAVLSAICQA